MQYKLRDYQKDSATAAIEFFNSDSRNNALIVLPTGSGKSLVISEIANNIEGNTLIFQPSKEILEQNFAKLQSYGVFDCSIYSASFNSKEISRITFATIGSVRGNPDLFKHFNNIIIDECHLVNAKKGMYKEFLAVVPSKVLGLTATPYRLTTDGFGGSILKFLTRTRPRVFTDLIYYSQISDLLNQGHLSKVDYYEIKSVDTRQLTINSTGADYTDKSVQDHYKDIGFSNQLISVVNRLINAERESILVFTRFIDEAQELVDKLNVSSEIVTGKTNKKERERILKGFKNGDIKVVANVGVLTTGFDYPELNTILLARPTMSLALYYQIVGRGIRPHKDKESCWFVDMCGVYRRFGKVEDLELTCDKPNLWYMKNKKKQLTNIYYGS